MATRAQEVLYVELKSIFRLNLVGNIGPAPTVMLLDEVSAEYMTLDFGGKPTEATTHKFKFTKDSSGVWTPHEEQGQIIAAFQCALPSEQEGYLESTSGYLYSNPGSPPVPFLRGGDIEANHVGRQLALVLPGIAKKYLWQVVENVVHEVALQKFKDLVESAQLKWGAAAAGVDATKASYRANTQIHLPETGALCGAATATSTTATPDAPTSVSVQ